MTAVTANGNAREIVYLIGSRSTPLMKIGFTTNLDQRLVAISRMSPVQLEVLWSTPGNYNLELALHRHFHKQRQHGEWFDLGEANAAIDAVSAAADAIRAGRSQKSSPVPADQRAANDDEEWITPTEAARRVVRLGYAASMTRQRIYQLAKDDPNWPAPRDQWRTFGAYKMLPWGPVELYFKERDARPGRPTRTEEQR